MLTYIQMGSFLFWLEGSTLFWSKGSNSFGLRGQSELDFPHHVGRCNREQKCGYHYTPKQYFADNPKEKEKPEVYPTLKQQIEEPIEPSYLAEELVTRSLKHYEANYLFLFFQSKFGERRAKELFSKYHVGTATHWIGATVFWQMDIQRRVRTGKVMLYDPQTGRRVKKPHNHITWVHSLMKQEDFHLKQCFFGEHLLQDGKSYPVAIVESEKTALIASIYIPQYIWLATGGKNGCLTKENMPILKNRKVVLFPDLGAKDYWVTKSEQMQEIGIDVMVSDYLERNASKAQIEEGYDIADFLIQDSCMENIYQTFLYKNPLLERLVEALDLKLEKISVLSSCQPIWE